MRAFGNNNERSQRSKTTNRAAALPEPLPEADGRQQDSKRKGPAEMVEARRDCPECQTLKRGHQNNDTLRDANKC